VGTVLAVTIPLLLGGLAWVWRSLYQSSRDAVEYRKQHYAKMLECASGFLITHLSVQQATELREEFIRLQRQLWVYAGDDVILAANAFTSTMDPRTLQQLAFAMRRDVNRIEIYPGRVVEIPKTKLSPSDFEVLAPKGEQPYDLTRLVSVDRGPAPRS
jgi:hypothetical protein